MNLPMSHIPASHVQRIPALYGAPWGIRGADSPLGLRTFPGAQTYYVDPSHGNTSDNNDGTSPDAPLQTITGAVGKVSNNGDQIKLAPGMYTESVYINDYTLYPSYVQIIGLGYSMFGVQWDSGLAASPCLIMGAVGWEVSGIRFYVPASAAAIVVPCTQAPYAANDIGIRSLIHHCYFDGSVNNGLYGIDLHGAPYDPYILENQFGFIHTAAGNNGRAIVSTNTGFADAYRAHIIGNTFYENDGHVDASLNVSEVLHNVFNCEGVIPTGGRPVLDLRAGTQGNNMVYGNIFGGDFSIAGGYAANAANPGSWVGNFAEDTVEAEVDAATALVNAIPT